MAAMPLGRRAVLGSRSFHFGSSGFQAALQSMQCAPPDYATKLRAKTIALIDAHDPASWISDPAVTLLRGEALTGGTRKATVDAFGRENGAIIEATASEVDRVIEHVQTFAARARDLRVAVRAAEADLLDAEGPHAAGLVANQAIDFGKQDGVTEMVEAVEANQVERALGDALAEAEAAGEVEVCRAPAFVACVSNFSNFLDLFRKSIRNLELGVPVVVLSRSNTTQHVFRWCRLLGKLLQDRGMDPGLVTFLAAPLSEQQRLLKAAPRECPLYFTGSRAVAAAIRSAVPRAVASTGGPNTLVATEYTREVAEAIKLSAAIENAGQCTALRHAVLPCTAEQARGVFDGLAVVDGPAASLREGQFAALLGASAAQGGTAPGPGYAPASGAAVRHGQSLPPTTIDEYWRRVVVDFTAPSSAEDLRSPAFCDALAAWLVAAQPISVAVNDREGDYALARRLFDRTGVVVFTCGSNGAPALTCQARPQAGEVFGEFPVRRELLKHTRFPMVVPTPTPGYNSGYSLKHLEALGKEGLGEAAPKGVRGLAACAATDAGRGYLRVLWEYLEDACISNPRRPPPGQRETLYGLQAPPLNGQLTWVRCGPLSDVDAVAAHLLSFVATTACPLFRVSVDPAARAVADALVSSGAVPERQLLVEDAAAFSARIAAESPFNVVDDGHLKTLGPHGDGYPLAGQFVSLLMCIGHVKSTKPKDGALVAAFQDSPRWLRLRKEV